MRSKIAIFVLLLLLILAGASLAQPVSASPPPQVVYQTPTPLADGKIIYVVQENDTCLRIQLLTGVTVQQIITLNKLDNECTLSVGKELVLMVIEPTPTITPNPEMTATPLLPTPTQSKGSGRICVELYNDVNGNGFKEDTEVLMPGGVASISDATGVTSKTGNTSDNVETPYCEEVPEGQYNVSMAAPDGYNATTAKDLSVPVQPGNVGYINFGAQVSAKAQAVNSPGESQPSAASPTADPNNNSMLLAAVGGLLLVAGVGLGVYVVVMRKS